jgi:glycerol-3-phosphate acyltransferase PlsY
MLRGVLAITPELVAGMAAVRGLTLAMTWWPWLTPLAAYLVGSVSFAWIAGRWNGVDLRQHGSRSLGATNAGRVLGGKWFFVVFALDVVKGWAPVYSVGRWLAAGGDGGTVILLLVGAAAVLGHVFTCFHGFKGGKAVATSLGVLIALLPLVAALSFAVWLLALLPQWAVSGRSRSDAVGPASVVAAVAAPIVHLVVAERPWHGPELPLTVFILLLAALVVLKHRSNVARLLARGS